MQQRLEPGSIVTFSGAQGTGKTIMKEKLSEYLRSHYDYTIVNQLPGVKKSIMRDLADRGLPINQEATLESQEYACTVFISKFVELRNQMRESTNTVAVLDRSMYDCFPYLWLHYRGSIVSLNNIRMYHVMRHMHEIVPQQIIFSGVADGGELHDGEYRSIDKAFQGKVDALFREFYRLTFQEEYVCKINSLDYDKNLEQIVEYFGL